MFKNVTEKVLCGVKLLPTIEAKTVKQKFELAAAQVGVSVASLRRGARLQRISPDDFKKLEQGNLAVCTVYKKIATKLPSVSLRKNDRLDVNRIVDETVTGAAHVCTGLELVKPLIDDIDQTKIQLWSDSLKESIKSLSKLKKQLERKKDI